MRRKNKLLAMLLALGAVLLAAFALGRADFSTAAEEEPAQVVFSLDPEAVTALAWDYSEPVSFEKRDGAWVYTEDASFPLDETYVEAILAALEEVTSSKTIENVENWDQYTLEVPVCAITVTAGGVEHDLKIGRETAVGGQRYFSTGDGRVYIIDGDVLEVFAYGLYDLLVYEDIPDMTDVQRLEVTSAVQSYTITRQEHSGLAYSDEYVWFLEDRALDTQRTQELLETVTDLYWGACANFNAQDLSAYGLDQPALTVTVDYIRTVSQATGETDEDGNAVYETVSTPEVFALEIGSGADSYSYARLAGSLMVYRIRSQVAETLLYTTYAELMPDEVVLLDWQELTAAEAELGGERGRFVPEERTVTDDEGAETQETVYLLEGQEVDFASVLEALDEMETYGYATGVEPERDVWLRFTFLRDNENYPEVELEFYLYNSTTCLTRLNGQSTVFVGREAVTDLAAQVEKLLDAGDAAS